MCPSLTPVPQFPHALCLCCAAHAAAIAATAAVRPLRHSPAGQPPALSTVSAVLETSESHYHERKHTFSLETTSDGAKYQSHQQINLEYEFQYKFLFKHLLPSY